MKKGFKECTCNVTFQNGDHFTDFSFALRNTKDIEKTIFNEIWVKIADHQYTNT